MLVSGGTNHQTQPHSLGHGLGLGQCPIAEKMKVDELSWEQPPAHSLQMAPRKCWWPTASLAGPRAEASAAAEFPCLWGSQCAAGPPQRALGPWGCGVEPPVRALCCLTLVDAPQGGINSTGLCPRSFLDVPCSRWRHCRAERETLGRVELDWIWLDWLCLGVILTKKVDGKSSPGI